MASLTMVESGSNMKFRTLMFWLSSGKKLDIFIVLSAFKREDMFIFMYSIMYSAILRPNGNPLEYIEELCAK
jgi:hypothetical protein